MDFLLFFLILNYSAFRRNRIFFFKQEKSGFELHRKDSKEFYRKDCVDWYGMRISSFFFKLPQTSLLCHVESKLKEKVAVRELSL